MKEMNRIYKPKSNFCLTFPPKVTWVPLPQEQWATLCETEKYTLSKESAFPGKAAFRI